MAEEAKTSIVTHSYESIALAKRDAARRRELADLARPANTSRAYGVDWARFVDWNEARGTDPRRATPDNVVAHLIDLRAEGFLLASIVRAASGIAHELRKHDAATWLSRPPEVRTALRDLARVMGRASKEGKAALLLESLCRGLDRAYPGQSRLELRNRALLLNGYYFASRRSELVGVRVGHIDTRQKGLGIGIFFPRSKTDQEGEGFSKFVHRQQGPYCPVRALHRWIASVPGWTSESHVFCPLTSGGNVRPGGISVIAVSRAVKEVAEAAGLDPDDYGAHSLRAGFVTDAAAKGIPLERIAHQTGHRSLEQLRRYIKRLLPSQNNATEGFVDG